MRRMLWGLALPLVVVAAAACGGDDVALDPAAAAATTRDAGSMRLAMTARMRAPEFGPRVVTMNATGVFDAKAQRGRMKFDLSGMQGGEQIGDVELVINRLVFYMRIPALRELAPTLKPWIRVDLAALGKSQGFDLDSLMQLGQNDPSRMLDYLRTAGEFETVGEEKIRGVETTHYRVRVDLDKYAELVAREQGPAAAETVRKVLDVTGQRTIPMDVWVDEDSLVRRMKFSQVLPADVPRGTKRGTAEVDVQLFDFGAPVTVRIPPRNQVMSLSELLAQPGRS